MLAVIPRSDEIDWPTWAAAVAGYNGPLENRLSPDMAWQDFAEAVALFIPDAPRPDFFDTWREWATALKLAVQG